MPSASPKLFSLLLLAALKVASAAGAAPVDPLMPASGGGLERVDRALSRLSTHARVLVVGAHPDDEDNALLAWVAARGGEGAYLALSRGEGGQNLIGPELGVGLGLIRSEELLAARRLEGNRQYFTRAYDFGYSKTLSEALERWPRDEILLDAVRVVRRFRPQVIVSIFRDGESPTHGQHQAAGVVAHAAFELAGDGTFDREQARVVAGWSPSSLFRRAWWRGEEEPTIALALNGLRATDGRSWRQLAAASRSMHRSQDMGSMQRLGPGRTEVVWVAGGAGPDTDSIFEGVDTSLAAIADLISNPAAREHAGRLLARAQAAAIHARRALSPVTLGDAVPSLLAIRRDLFDAERAIGGDLGPGSMAATALLREKRSIAESALLAAAGVVIDARVDRARLVGGQSAEVTVSLWNTSGRKLMVTGGTIEGAVLGAATPWAEPPRAVPAGELAEWQTQVTVAPNAAATVPYFLRSPRVGDRYDWSALEPAEWGAPFGEPPLTAELTLALAGAEMMVSREVVHAWADQAVGEIRDPVRVVPVLEVEASPARVVRPVAGDAVTTVAVRLRSHAEVGVRGRVEIEAPAGWPTPEGAAFEISDAEGSAALELEVELPVAVVPGHFRLPVVATLEDGSRHAAAFPVTAYPHARARPRPVAAGVDLTLLDLAIPTVRVAWIVGASEVVPVALERLGLAIDRLAAEAVAEADLAVYDTVVVGSRAYETNPALGRANAKLLDFAREGGNLVVLYQQYQFSRAGFAPFEFEIARPHDRVTDEASPVRVLRSDHAAFTRPNRLTAADWEGWVQERGLYFPGRWGPEFEPLLAMADPGEEEKFGGLLVAPLGDGIYVYTGLSFFREIPAGVPGAYRLLVNLLALGEGS